MTGGLVKYTFRAIGRLVWLAEAVLAMIIGDGAGADDGAGDCGGGGFGCGF